MPKYWPPPHQTAFSTASILFALFILPMASASSRQLPDFFQATNGGTSPLLRTTRYGRQPKRIFVSRQFPIRYRRAREECSEEEMLEAAADVPTAILTGLLMEQKKGPILGGAKNGEGKNCSGIGKTAKGKRQHWGEIRPDMALDLRALCPFERTINFDGHRLPKRIPEIRCICNQPDMAGPSGQLRCEPLYYDVQVLKFEPNCQQFRPTVQRVSLGCVAAFKSRFRSDFEKEMGEAESAPIGRAIR